MSADKITPEALREFEERWHPQGFDAWWAREMEYQGFTSAHDGARRAWHECSRAHADKIEECERLKAFAKRLWLDLEGDTQHFTAALDALKEPT